MENYDSEYENCMEVLKNNTEPQTIEDFFDEPIEDSPDEHNDWRKHWVGMPEFIQENQHPFRKIQVNIKTEKDLEKFEKLLGQNISPNAKSIWFPYQKRPSKLWIFEGDEEEINASK